MKRGTPALVLFGAALIISPLIAGVTLWQPVIGVLLIAVLLTVAVIVGHYDT